MTMQVAFGYAHVNDGAYPTHCGLQSTKFETTIASVNLVAPETAWFTIVWPNSMGRKFLGVEHGSDAAQNFGLTIPTGTYGIYLVMTG